MIPSFDRPDHDGEDMDEWGHHSQPDPSTEIKQTPQELRQMANAAVQQHDLDSALPLYSMAIDTLLVDFEKELNENEDPNNEDQGETISTNKKSESCRELMIILLCNRSVVLHRMELYQDAKNDAAEALRMSDNKSAKAAFRLAKAQLELKELEGAITILQQAVENITLDIQSMNQNGNGPAKSGDGDGDGDGDAADNNGKDNDNGVDEQELQELHEQKLATQQTLKTQLQNLLQTAQYHHLSSKNIPNPTTLSKLSSCRISNHQPSIREFSILDELGEGNYSRVVAVRHTVTREKFALKIIEKKKVESLAKRQHPNVRNEIQMEKRILGERIGLEERMIASKRQGYPYGWSRLVNMYHTFQDYNNLYYLMDLYDEGGDMWSKLRLGDKMVGIHHSVVKTYLFELLEALEFIHARGVVHRDLKAENLLLSSRGHLILIDFGTAKDLIETDLNGPEFVGTPDFMSPEAIKGTGFAGDKKEEKDCYGDDGGSDHAIDLWAFGALAYQLLTGTTPFTSPSQYLTFLRIQRGVLCRPMGITDDDAWDLIKSLMKVKPQERLGSECFEYVKGQNGEPNKMIQKGDGYYALRNHPYFAGYQSSPPQDETMPIPTLRDLCIRACGQLVQNDSTNLDIDKTNPPGDASSHDMLRLNKEDRGCVMDFLDKLRVLSQPRIYRRFFKSKQEARLGKVRENTRDFVGLTQMNDKQYQFPMKDSDNTDEEQSDVIETIFPIQYMHVNNPLFDKDTNLACTEEERKSHISALKDSLKRVNRTRPKVVVASGYLDEECRKFMGKVNESIPVALNDGSAFYAFWSRGGQGLVLRAKDFVGDESNVAKKCAQTIWLKQELEQSKMTQHHTFAFVDCDPDMLPDWLIKLLAEGRVLCLFGTHHDSIAHERDCVYSTKEDREDKHSSDKNDDEASLSSLESGAEGEEHTMKIIGRGDGTLRCVQLEEYGAWEFKDASNN